MIDNRHVQCEAEKRNPFSFIQNFFNMQYNLTEFGFLFINDLSSMLYNWFLSWTLIYALYLEKSLCQYYIINHGVQDSAAVHLAWETVEFIPPLWTPNSPDLYPLDRSICQVIQDRVYQEKIDNVDELKQQIVRVCNETEQTFNQWHKRLQMCVWTGGSYFEHLMLFCSCHFICVCWQQRHWGLYIG